MKFSILTPSYNYAHWLPDTLASVAGQTGDFEVEHVVVDDGSTDGSVEVLRSWPGPLVLHEKPNAGLAHTLNTALSLASGDVIGWLNADDYYLPGTLAAVARVFDEHSEADVVFGDSLFVDADGGVLRLVPLHRFDESVLRRFDSYLAVCAAFRRVRSLPAPAWDERLRVVLDWDQDLRMAAAGATFVHVPQALGAFRRHGAQVSAKAQRGDAAEWRYFVDKHDLPDTATLRGRALVAAGHLHHAALKAAARGYARQRRVMRLRGRPTQWWRDEQAVRTIDAVRAAYR